MNPNDLEMFRNLFEGLIASEVAKNERRATLKLIQTSAKGDDADISSEELEKNFQLRLQGRSSLYVKKLSKALEKISDGSFGVCESCGCDIEIKRLKARPCATKCVCCKEEEETMEKHILYIKRSKTQALIQNNKTIA